MRLSGLVAVFFGAGIGGVLRYTLGGVMAERWGSTFLSTRWSSTSAARSFSAS